MEVEQLQRSFLEYSSALFREGFLDTQFNQLQLLQDESNPDFVFEVVSLFFDDSQRLLNDLTIALEQQNVDFKKIDAHVHQFKGSSSSFCEDQNGQECMRCLQQVKEEYLLVKAKLEALLRLEQQIVAAGGAIPMLNEYF